MSGLQNNVLVVDDELLIALSLSLQIEGMGMAVCGMAATAEEAIALAQQHRPSIVLMDVRLRGIADGVDAACAIHDTVGSNVIFITGSSEPATLERIQLGYPSGVLFKPITDRQLRTAIDSIVHR